MGFHGFGRIHAGHVDAMILHHVAGAVIPRPQERAQAADCGTEFVRDLAGEADERPKAGLNIMDSQFGADRHGLGINAGIKLAAQLGL